MTNNDETAGDELEISRTVKAMEADYNLHHGTDGPRPDFVESAKAHIRTNLLDPDMSEQELKLHCGEMTAQEIRTARAIIKWANSRIVSDVGE